MGIPMKTSAPIAAPNDWTGLYVGGFVGAGWGTDSATLNSAAIAPGVPLNLPLAQVSNSGFIGGGQIGYNYQQGWVVWGVEGDFAATDIKGTAPCLVIFSCPASDNWLATASARV